MTRLVPQYDLDWNSGRVQAKDIPRHIVEEKFYLWDEFVESVLISRGLATSGMIQSMKDADDWVAVSDTFNKVFDVKDSLTDEEQDLMGELLKDDCIYAYAILRWEGMPIRLRYFQDALMSDDRKRIDVEASNQSGKEQPLSAKILTPTGWTTMGNICVGNEIVGQDGLSHKVSAVFPQGVKPVYKLTFDDGSTAECGLNHLWKFIHPNNRFERYSKKGTKYCHSNYGKYQVASLKDILKIGGMTPSPRQRIVIPVCEPVVFPTVSHIIQPYTLGALLGDGMLRHWVGFTCASKDIQILKRIESELPKGQYLTQKTEDDYSLSSKGYCQNKIKNELRRMSLWGTGSNNKFIPQEYLFDSIDNRISLLRGLMDTDGTIDKKGCAEFYSVSKQLAQGVRDLVQSLGGKAEISLKPSWYKNKDGNRVDCQLCYRVKVKLEDIVPFYLNRKAERHYKIRYRKERILQKIELVRQEESKCILVDSEDHTYLTDNYIVTHNSFSLCVKAAIKFLRAHGKNCTIGLISKSMPQNSMNMRMTTKMLQEAYVPYNPGINDNMTVRINELEGSITNTLVCAVASTSALGFPFDYLLLDEFEFWENPEGLEYMYDQVLEPRTFHTKGQIIIYSNPNGKNFVSENLHKRKIGEEFQFHVYNVNFLDVPGNTREEWDLKQSYTHPIMFASTMAARRTESEGAALTERDIQKTFSDDLDSLGFRGINPSVDNAWFLDLGFVYDQSVLAGCYLTKNDKEEVLYNFAIKCYPQQHPHTEIWGFESSDEDSVPTIVKRFGGDMARFELDLTGKEGNEINANKAGLDCAGIKMSGPWKAKWFDRFITLVKQGRIKVQQIDNWLDTQNKHFAYQARSLRISTKMPDGRSRPYPLYHHTTEKDHDDILDAIIGCLSMIDEDMSDGDSYEMSFVQNNNNNEKHISTQVPTFDEFIKDKDIPSFMTEDNLREWYNKRYGLN
jgi:hypothetical protein